MVLPGIRVGVDKEQLAAYGVEAPPLTGEDEEEGDVAGDVRALELYDWFGSIDSPVKRGRERMSIIFAFNDPQ